MDTYIVTQNIDSNKLEREINLLLKNGWKCIGGLAMIWHPRKGQIVFGQAMMKNFTQLDAENGMN